MDGCIIDCYTSLPTPGVCMYGHHPSSSFSHTRVVCLRLMVLLFSHTRAGCLRLMDHILPYPGRLYAHHCTTLPYPGRLSAQQYLSLPYPGRVCPPGCPRGLEERYIPTRVPERLRGERCIPTRVPERLRREGCISTRVPERLRKKVYTHQGASHG